MRWDSVAIEDVLAAATVRPVHIGFFDIKDHALRGWSGPGAFLPTGTGDDDLDDNVFLAVEGAIEITDFTENQGMGEAISLTFPITDELGGFILGEGMLGIDPLGQPQGPIFDHLVTDRRLFMGRKAVIWLAFLQEEEDIVENEIQRMFTGVMVGASVQRQVGQPTTVTLICDQDLQKANTAPLRLIDHQVFYPSDTASTFINSLSRGGIATAREVYGDFGEGPGSFQRYIRDEMRRG
jgi:hypothetical protein